MERGSMVPVMGARGGMSKGRVPRAARGLGALMIWARDVGIP